MGEVTITPGAPAYVIIKPQVQNAVELKLTTAQVALQPREQAAVELSLTSRGIQGPPGPMGPPGPNTIGGYPIEISELREFDLLQFLNSAWRNTPQTALTDGGNF